jgi:hypothetical protein
MFFLCFINAERPNNGFSFDELNTINNMFERESDRRLEHEQKYGNTLQPLPPRKETMFAELSRLFN